jgi:ABC-type long-subunit fatty acid transport system fused permease/ATPase subunit
MIHLVQSERVVMVAAAAAAVVVAQVVVALGVVAQVVEALVVVAVVVALAALALALALVKIQLPHSLGPLAPQQQRLPDNHPRIQGRFHQVMKALFLSLRRRLF